MQQEELTQVFLLISVDITWDPRDLSTNENRKIYSQSCQTLKTNNLI